MRVLSAVTTSHRTPAGYKPAAETRSMVASVWPARFNTPPGRYRRGKMCPGRFSSAAWVWGSMRAWIVDARSSAEIPVVVPLR